MSETAETPKSVFVCQGKCGYPVRDCVVRKQGVVCPFVIKKEGKK